MRSVIFSAVLAALTSPASADELAIDFPAIEVHDMVVAYACDEGGLEVRYVNAGATSLAIFDWQGERIVASSGVAASGVRYVGGRFIWWAKGNEASLYNALANEQVAPLANCRIRP